MKSLLALALAAILIQGHLCIKCYDCDSQTPSVSCDKKDNFGNEKGCEEEFDICFKRRTVYDNGTKVYQRGCAKSSDNFYPTVSKCAKSEGLDGSKTIYCVCLEENQNGEPCNGTNQPSFYILTILGLFSMVKFLL